VVEQVFGWLDSHVLNGIRQDLGANQLLMVLTLTQACSPSVGGITPFFKMKQP
jgi:hypothetical protein